MSDKEQIKVDWDKWEKQYYKELSVYGKIWHQAESDNRCSNANT